MAQGHPRTQDASAQHGDAARLRPCCTPQRAYEDP
jgi:hypothetical protein